MRQSITEETTGRIWKILFAGILAVSVLRFFYGITGDYFTFLDEYITFDTAAGFTHTGKFYLWDFHKEALTDQQYTRAWPHTVLLMIWFKLFGIHVTAGKTLSAVFGVLFIVSLFTITKKIYHNYYISGLSCLFVMTNSTVATVFRQIRMYSLWLLITLWLIYFIYRMLTVKPAYRGTNRLVTFWNKNLNFSVKYIIYTLLLFALGYFVHLNTLAIGVGMCLFYGYLLITKQERRYVTALGCIFGLVVVATFAVPWLAQYNADINSIYWNVIVSGHVGLREEVNIRYWYWVLDFIHSRRFFWFSLVCVIIAFLKNIRKRNGAFDFSMYAFLVAGSTLCCFLFFLSRYYASRYMLYVAPLLAVLMAWGIIETATILKWKPLLWSAAAVSVLFSVVNIGQEFTNVYHNPQISYHRAVYEIVKEDAQKELSDGGTLPIAGYDFRDYYGVQVLDNYETAAFDRENDMEILKAFALDYPDGYVLVETTKINGFPEVIKNFIQKYSEKIAGEGLDHYNIETVRYHFAYPITQRLEMNPENTVQNGPVTYSFAEDGGHTTVKIELDTSLLESHTDTLFVKFGIFTLDKQTEDKCYQLRLPQRYSGGKCYYEITMDKACQVVLLKDECMLYYTDGSCREKLLYEK